jgi:hypothetical protein
MGGILDFLFGKDAKIFDKKGNIQHDLPDSKWSNWNNRYQQGPEYNWQSHTGMKSPVDNPPKIAATPTKN